MTRTEGDAEQVHDNTLSTVTAGVVDVDNCDAGLLENETISQQEDKYETSTDKTETTVWSADNETTKTPQVKVKQVKQGGVIFRLKKS